MRSTFYGMEVARSGLYTAQNQLNITGHNISNVDTAGYTRQRLSTANIPPQSLNVQIALDTRALAGRGVEALTVAQIRNDFLDVKMRIENSDLGYWRTTADEFSIIEGLFNDVLSQTETGNSLVDALSDFKAAISDLGTDKSASAAIRTALRDAATALTESVNFVYTKLERQHNDLNTAVSLSVDQINDYAQQIARLNKDIYSYELSGSNANDLKDHRNLLLDELSGIVDIDYYHDPRNHLVVTVGGRALVNGVEYSQMAVRNSSVNKLDEVNGTEPPGMQYEVRWADDFGNPGNLPEDAVKIQSGALKAYIDMRDGTTEGTMGIPYVANQLNTLCRNLAEQVNAVHRRGYTLPYKADELYAGGDVFAHAMEYDADGNPTVAEVNGSGNYAWLQLHQTPVTDSNGTQYYESVNGIDFFYTGGAPDYSGLNAKNFRLSDEVLNNVSLIAVSTVPLQVPDEGWPDSNQFNGNCDNIMAVSNLFYDKNELGLTDNFESWLKNMIVMIANNQKHLNSLNDTQQTKVDSLEYDRQAISGVSLDDEMVNMIKYQHAYNASSRMITAIDEQLNTIINSMGLVGR